MASGVVRVGNSVDCTVHCYTHFGAPIIYGDTRNLCLGPHNAGFSSMNEVLIRGGINPTVTTSRVQSFLSPSLMHVPKQAVSFMQPLEFMRLVVPKHFGKDEKL